MIPPGRKGALQPFKLDGDTSRARGTGDLNSFDSHVESAYPSVRWTVQMLSNRGGPLLTLMLLVIVVGLPLLAWLADLALLDAAATRSWIEGLVRDVEEPP
jgi:hypothetical protein